jgi:hypothetical protein
MTFQTKQNNYNRTTNTRHGRSSPLRGQWRQWQQASPPRRRVSPSTHGPSRLRSLASIAQAIWLSSEPVQFSKSPQAAGARGPRHRTRRLPGRARRRRPAAVRRRAGGPRGRRGDGARRPAAADGRAAGGGRRLRGGRAAASRVRPRRPRPKHGLLFWNAIALALLVMADHRNSAANLRSRS